MRCHLCGEVIKQPLCPDCLAEGVKAIVGEALGKEFADKITPNNLYTDESLTCIKCHSEFSVCPHCFLTETIELLSSDLKTLAKVLLLLEDPLMSSQGLLLERDKG